MELSLPRLWQLRRYVLGVGLVQVGVCIVVIGTIIRMSGITPPAGLVLGMCFALSSTAIVMQLLIDQHRAATPVGRVALSVLLFQDLMVVPILFTHRHPGSAQRRRQIVGRSAAAVRAGLRRGRFHHGGRPLCRDAADALGGAHRQPRTDHGDHAHHRGRHFGRRPARPDCRSRSALSLPGCCSATANIAIRSRSISIRSRACCSAFSSSPSAW